MKQAIFLNDGNALNDILKQYQNAMILCDHNTEKHCLPLINKDLSLPVIKIQPGESNKSPFSLNYIWNQLLVKGADRSTVLINLGGGIISDIGGFAAATYNRGIKFINIPTTLMGMVDAATGGKTGINFNGLKNYIGSFSEAEAIYIWPGFLKTLPFEQIQSGYAEMLKHGLIADAAYFEKLAENDLAPGDINTQTWLPVIKKSLKIKNSIVARDYTEKGERKFLNFGHTIGHAMESHFLNSNLPHGHFISAGIICESYLSHTIGHLGLSGLQKVIISVDKFFARIPLTENDISEIAHLALKDKKNNLHKIRCVFLNKIGTANIDNTITLKNVKESLSFYNS